METNNDSPAKVRDIAKHTQEPAKAIPMVKADESAGASASKKQQSKAGPTPKTSSSPVA